MFLMAVAKNLSNDEMVKKMQEQVISMQDKQISFLNNNISTTLTTISIVVAIIGVVALGLGTWIGLAHKSAKKRMTQAEEKMTEAFQKMEHAEKRITKADETINKLEIYREEINKHKADTDQSFREISATIDERMKMLKEIEGASRLLVVNHHIKLVLAEVDEALHYASDRINAITKMDWFDPKVECLEYEDFVTRHKKLVREYGFLRDHQDSISLTEAGLFYQECSLLRLTCINLIKDVEIFKYGEGAEQAVFEKYKDDPRPLPLFG